MVLNIFSINYRARTVKNKCIKLYTQYYKINQFIVIFENSFSFE